VFIPQILSLAHDECKSFPSRHSANVATLIWISMLPTFIKGLQKKTTFLLVIAISWTVMVMISRMIMGAHFLSDVIIGATIGLVCFFVVKDIVLKNISAFKKK